MNLLPQSYYQRSDILMLSRDLLGKIIISRINGETTAGRIVETEAYRAPEDRGSHAYGNKKTQRTETVFRKGGHTYIYLCYGIHHLCNVVSGGEGIAHAILIRAIEPIDGIEVMHKRRGIKKPDYNLTNGPGKWTQAMGITTSSNNIKYYAKKSPIQIHDADPIPESEIISSPRVGIAYAQAWAHMPWRYRIKNNKWTSKPDQVNYIT